MSRSLLLAGFVVATLSLTSALACPGATPTPLVPDAIPEGPVADGPPLSDSTSAQVRPPKAAPKFARAEDVIYGRRDGLALTMDVFTPKDKANGAGVIVFVSAEYRSGRNLLGMFHPITTTPFLDHGYVVFTVMHGSQPKYTVPEILDDAHRALRFVKHNAKKYGIDPGKIGVAGGSAGGHLSLMMGCAGKAGDPKASDPVERESSNAAAVACFFPPTDFLALERLCPKEITAPFDFREFDASSGKYKAVTPDRRLKIGRDISPVTHAAKDSAPTLIIHGDEDKLAPIGQSQIMIAKLQKFGVECKLEVRQGEGHFGRWIIKDLPLLADWFDHHLLGQK